LTSTILRHYLTVESGERGEDARVDEIELRLNLVTTKVVDWCTVLIQDQVLGVRPKPMTKQTIHWQCPSGNNPTSEMASEIKSPNVDKSVQRVMSLAPKQLLHGHT
jgi:hypothetical protein